MTTRTETIALDAIAESDNIRSDLGDIAALAENIGRVGLLNPVTVRPAGDGETFDLIAGYRRVAAARKLGWTEIPATVLPASEAGLELREDPEALTAHLAENLQRADLDPFDEAEGLATLSRLLGGQTKAARAVGRSKAHVSKRLALLRLSEPAREAVSAGVVPLEDAPAVAKLPEDVQTRIVGRFESGTSPATVRAHLEKALKNEDRDAAARKAARAVSRQDHRQDVTVVASPDVPAGWRPLEGWQGLAVDFDEHLSEPCSVLVVGYRNDWDEELGEIFYCSAPARHDHDGESAVKVENVDRQAEIDARNEEDRRLREERRLEVERRRALVLDFARSLTTRDVVRGLALHLVASLRADDLTEVAGLFGIDLPVDIPDAPETWEQTVQLRAAWLEHLAGVDSASGIDTAKLARAAAFVVLRSTVADPGWYDTRDARLMAAAFGLDLDPEVGS